PAHGLLGSLLRAGGRWRDLAELERQMVGREPASPARRVQLAQALLRTGALSEAMAAADRAYALDPAGSEAANVGAAIQALLGHAREARFRFEAVLAGDAGNAAANAGLAALDLAEGNYASGFARHEERFNLPELAAFRGGTPRLAPMADSPDLEGKRVLVTAERAFSDTLQFLRYAPALAARGATVIAEVQPQMVALARHIYGVSEVVAQGDIGPGFDLTCAVGSLPHIMGTSIDTVPTPIPYIKVPDGEIARWRDRLAAAGERRRIGLCWSGDPTYALDGLRSMPLAALRPLLDDPALAVHLLQGDRSEDDAAVVAQASDAVDLGAELSSFIDTAGAIAAMDLVITVDTATAHLAGALGVPVWVMLPRSADWRWIERDGRSVWYPSARLFRQQHPQDWRPVVAAVHAALGAG
ncbi:MAG: hypothetical protein J0M16_11145, partial [Gammaproteobacteria bacterium]|nr:hypothetical protein [Gammaproteobacteria bacterium]